MLADFAMEMKARVRTFLAGLPSAAPSSFSTAPLILPSILAFTVLSFLTGAFLVVLGFATRPVAVFFERGLDVLAFVVLFFLVERFLVGIAGASTSAKMRGFELPVLERVVRDADAVVGAMATRVCGGDRNEEDAQKDFDRGLPHLISKFALRQKNARRGYELQRAR
jgi:uncharacterized membrane protein YphA (DoxX/SURF4 family)